MGSQEIASTALAGDANLVQYTRFEGNSTATVGGNGTDTDITYGTTYGKFGQGALFNGSSSKVVVASLKPTVLSFSAWIKPTNLTAEKVFFSMPNNDIDLCLETDGKILLAVYNGTAYEWYYSTGTVSSGVWSHVSFTYSSTTKAWIIYINGVSAGYGTGTTALSWEAGASSVTIGARNSGSRVYIGSIDDVAVFNRLLTSDEIYSLYKTGVKKLNGVSNVLSAPSGGTITTDGLYTVHKFVLADSGTSFTTNKAGNVAVLVVGGGGGEGGGVTGSSYDAGGGGGQVTYNSSVAVTATSYTIVVGAGGVGHINAAGGDGYDSTFNSTTVVGKKGLGPTSSGNESIGGTSGNGHTGGSSAGNIGGGGGGGDSQNGSNGVSLAQGGAGGNGTSSTIYDSTTRYYGGGGGGGAGTTGGTGGTGGGGNGSANDISGLDGSPDTGGGSGGGSDGGSGVGTPGHGGSGIVIIRYLTSDFATNIKKVNGLSNV